MDKERKTTLVPKCQRKWLLTIWHYGAPHHRGCHHSSLGSKEWNITVLKFAFIESKQFQIFPPDRFQRKLFPNLFLAFKTPTIMDLPTTPKNSMISASFEAGLRYLQKNCNKDFGIDSWYATRVDFTETREVGLHGYEPCQFNGSSSFFFLLGKRSVK